MDDEYYNIGDETFILPSDFTFKPAHGIVQKDGSVTVSGYNFSQREIQNIGSDWRDLIDILKEIKTVRPPNDET